MKSQIQLLFLVAFGLMVNLINAQTKIVYPYFSVGDNVIHITNHAWRFAITSKMVYLPMNRSDSSSAIFFAPENDEIMSGSVFEKKVAGKLEVYMVLILKSDRMVFLHLDPDKLESVYEDKNLPPGEFSKDIIDINGDDFYVLTKKNLYVSRDTLKTWQSDTVGLGAVPVDLAFDTSHFIYALLNNSLYKQAEGSNNWIKISGLSGSGFKKVFVDQRLRIFVSGFNRIYKSTDGGNSFTIDTSGMEGQQAINFGEDAFGNIYCIASNSFVNSGNRIYRKLFGSPSWQRIDQTISNLIVNPESSQIYNCIGGKDSLFLGTSFGLFLSVDSGSTWNEVNKGIKTKVINGFTISKSGIQNISCQSGIYRLNQNTWTKSFPSNGYLFGRQLFKDNLDVIYTTTKQTNPALFNNSPREVWKSTDNGVTWTIDTPGLSKIKMNSFYVDETGTQHAASAANGGAMLIYSKTPGSSWSIDTIGFNSGISDIPICWGSDLNGTIYLATNSTKQENVWKRNSNGTWVKDCNGITNTTVYSFAVEKNGTMLAGTYDGLYHRINGVWSKINNPSGTNPNFTNACFVVAVDSSGDIWTQYSILDNFGNAIGTGVYFSSDHGSTWTSLKLDTITFKQFIPFKNMIYAISYYDGLFLFLKTGGNGVHVELLNDEKSKIYITSNPANNKAKIDFDTEIFNEKGLVVITNEKGSIIHKEVSTQSTLTLQTSSWQSGIYNITYYTSYKTLSTKLIIMH